MSDDDRTHSGVPNGGQGRSWLPDPPPPDDDYARWLAGWQADLQRTARPARRPRPVMGLFLAGLALFCAAFFAAPVFAFRAVRSAAHYGDVQALGEAVDYPAVRQSLRVQLRPDSIERKAPAGLFANPLDAVRRALEPMRPQPEVDAHLSPQALAALLAGMQPEADAPRPQGVFGGPLPRLRYWAFDRARLGVVDPADRTRETVFTFRRSGLFAWRLAGVRLPQPAPPSADHAALAR